MDKRHKLANRSTESHTTQTIYTPKKDILDKKLKELKHKLTKPFKSEFIDSLCYLIELEHNRQTQFDSCVLKFQWSRLDYFLQQLKKICKQKNHLLLLVNGMCINHVRLNENGTKPVFHGNEKNNNNDDLNCTNVNLVNEIDNLENRNEEHFSLAKIILRFLFKMFKFNLIEPSKRSEILKAGDEEKAYNLQLVLLSCLADLCHYEELRAQVLNDSNLDNLLKIFAVVTSLELEEKTATGCSIQNTDQQQQQQKHSVRLKQLLDKSKKLWSRMCRMTANLCGEKNAQTKNLIKKDFLLSLLKCIERQNQYLQSRQRFEDLESNSNDLDFFHSLIRFFKYGCELSKCKSLILENRLLVYICRFMQKYSKSVQFLNEKEMAVVKEQKQQPAPVNSTSTSEAESNNPTTTTTNTNNENITILMNPKFKSLFKDLIKNYLILLDNWPHPLATEFYNQIIEGNLIEHLLWLQIDDAESKNSLVSNDDVTNNESTKQTTTKTAFNYSDFSFNILFKLCRDYHACRAEFGRVGGLSKYITKLEQWQEATGREFERLVEMLCFSCKESVNRLRLKEQSQLHFLVKLQQKLKKSASLNNSADSSVYNKLLVALCCFAHDQDSMNALLGHGLVDALLTFLNDSINEQLNTANSCSKTYDLTKIAVFDLKECEKKISLKTLLNRELSLENSARKRKASDSILVLANSLQQQQQTVKIKRSKMGSHQASSPSFFQSIDLTAMDTQTMPNQCTSPTESYCSLSPNANPFSPAFSLPSPSSRCNSALMFLSSSTSNLFFSPIHSPSQMTTSPNVLNDEQHATIQYSPSIKNDESDVEMTNDNDDVKFSLDTEIVKEATCIKLEDSSESNFGSRSDLSNQSIESINRTEACVFYVLSQLSHGDKPSAFLFANFEPILVCLLNYLKHAKVRNPRALRILNRLTKNHYCFHHFILSQFPYKIKSIFYGRIDDSSLNSNLSSASKHNQNEDEIEKEMNIYLNSNKVFFDAHTYFPSFHSIEFTLCNNLKSQCISSSDHGYLCLISMMKYAPKRSEKLSGALVAPFILRNSKALQYIMLHLNGIELLLDSLFLSNDDDSNCDKLLRSKAVFCLRKILNFVSFKQPDLTKVKESFNLVKQKLTFKTLDLVDKNENLVEFYFDDDLKMKVSANRCLLSEKSEYFNALLNGHFAESTSPNPNQILIKDCSFKTFSILIELLQCNNEPFVENMELTFDLCVELILACDRFFLSDLKEFFVLVLILKFLKLSNLLACFRLAWMLNSSMLETVVVELFLSRLVKFPRRCLKSEAQQFGLSEMQGGEAEDGDGEGDESEDCESFSEEMDKINDEMVKCSLLIEYSLNELKMSNFDSVGSNLNGKLIEQFRKSLKTTLSEIIKK